MTPQDYNATREHDPAISSVDFYILGIDVSKRLRFTPEAEKTTRVVTA